MGFFDGVFKKEACAVCGKEVGMLSRSKLQDKQYICDDCRKNINPFIRSDYITLEEFHQAVRQAEQDQKLLENAPSDSSYLQHGSESIAVKHYYTKGVFTIQSNRHRNAKYPPVFYYNEVRPYDPSANFVEKQMGSDPRRLGNMNLITLEEKHASDGTNDGWTIQFPYNHKGIRNVQIEIGKDFDAKEVKAFYDRVRSTARWRENTKSMQREQEMNMMNTFSDVLKAKMTGGNVDEALAKGKQRAEDIANGKEKEGFFSKFFS